MKILFSVSYNQTFDVPQGKLGAHSIDVAPMKSDWGLRGARKRLFHVQRAWSVARRARNYDALALCTVGIEAFFVALFRPILCPRTRIVVTDLLMPRPGKFDGQMGRWLRRIESIVIIRRGDAETLKTRFGYPPEKCHFAFFSVAQDLPAARSDGDFFYAAGHAHRDWQTLLAALKIAPRRAILSPGSPLEVPDELAQWVEVRPGLSPEQGRALLAQSKFVVLPFIETPLPSGPLVLLDAMGMGKAVAVSSVNGSRDYVKTDETALVVPHANAQALSDAIVRLSDDATLRENLGAAAKRDVYARFSNEFFIAAILEQCAA